MITALALGEITVDDGQGLAVHRETAPDQSPLGFLTIPWISAMDVLGRLAGEQGHTIMGLLAMEMNVVPHGFHFIHRELIVVNLGFLQADNVRVQLIHHCL